jgi:radical SAM protein with 4Fe4S-binding SPASM domain
VPIEWQDVLDAKVALRFLGECAAVGVRTIGFTGGEPFLCPDFLERLSRRAAKLGLRFDKISTNGAWWRDVAHLESTLRRLIRAGYSGRLGLSVDRFHPVKIDVLAQFCRSAASVSGREDVLTISWASASPKVGLERVQALARALGGVLEFSPALGAWLMVAPDVSATLNFNHLAAVERAEGLADNWDGAWFEEDWCEGPGQALVVNPRGEVKPCCGFASDLDQLAIGNIHSHSAAEIVRRGREHPYVGKVFSKGLSAIRDEILAKDPAALPGKTTNHCFFCWYALTRGLAVGMPGKGGQAGNWVDEGKPRVPVGPGPRWDERRRAT